MENYGKDKPVYMISVAAELTGMHPQTLRTYEQRGLITPGRSSGNTRLYSQADIDKINLIGKLSDEGINLAGVIRILDLQARAQNREQEIGELQRRIRDLENQLAELQTDQKILALKPYEQTGPEQLLRKLLGASNQATNLTGEEDANNQDS